MHNIILYKAFTPQEINACAYALLKYLGVYNLKPPSSHSLVIYTNNPAALEAYGSFFHQFELKTTAGNGSVSNTSSQRIIKEFDSIQKGNLLYLDSYTYLTRELEPLFASIEKGKTVVRCRRPGKTTAENRTEITVLGLNTSLHDPGNAMHQSEKSDSADHFITSYSNFREFDLLLKKFFTKYQEESIPNLVKLVSSLDADHILQQKNAFSKLPLLTRFARKVSGKGWGMKEVMRKL